MYVEHEQPGFFPSFLSEAQAPLAIASRVNDLLKLC